MSLKKRMFRSYMMFLFYSLCALFCVTTLAGVSFSGQFSKKFEALQDAQLNVNVMEAAGMMEADYGGDWERQSMDFGALRYDFFAVQDGRIVYGDHQGEGEELLRDFPLEKHQSGQVELFYLQGMTVLGKYDVKTGTYLLAVGGTEIDWWKVPIQKSGSTLVYLFLAVVVLGAAALLVLSAFFTGRLVRKITEPLDELEKGARRIREGKLGEPVRYQGDEEFEQLCQTFNDMQESMQRAVKERERQEQARTDMITGISHDLRTPLTTIQGYIKGILDGVAGTEEKQKNYLRIAYNATKEMNILLQNLFDFSKMESGQMPLHMGKGDLGELAASWVAQKEQMLEREKAVFNFSRSGEVLPEIIMDAEQMRRVFENLLENSLKYAGISPVKIEMSVYVKRDEVVLEWLDNGRGVPEDKLGRIFERFYRCDEARSIKGSGVGLYVVRWIVEQHGGRVTAENQGGLLLRMYFPKGGR